VNGETVTKTTCYQIVRSAFSRFSDSVEIMQAEILAHGQSIESVKGRYFEAV
jgi:hypothetical protein